MSAKTSSATCPDCGEDIQTVNGRFIQHGACPGWFCHVTMVDQAADRLESRFTPPTDHCRHPERYHSADADSAEDEVTQLVAAFVTAVRPDFVLETGTAWGQTAKAIGEHLPQGHLFTLEPDPARCAVARDRCKDLPVTVVEAESLSWTPPDGVEFGFAWFDSLLNLRVPEFGHFRKWMAPKAIVAFHDTAPHQGTLRREIMAAEEAGLLLPLFINSPRGVCFAEVT